MFFNILKHTLKNIVRNKFLTFSSILIIGLLMFFIDILIILHGVSLNIIQNVNEKISINLYLKEDTDKESKEFRDFHREMKKVANTINIEYKSKEVIKEQYAKKDPELIKITSGVDNPFPNTILISNINVDDYEKINNIIEPRTTWVNAIFDVNLKKIKNAVNSYKQEYKEIKKVIQTFKILTYAVYFFIFIFVISIFIIIYSIIWNFIFHYRNEIFITKLIGWGKRFIYWPFTLQWIIYAILAFFVSLIWLYYLMNFLPDLFAFFETPFDYDMTIFYPTFKKILPIELAVFVFIGAISGLLSSRKYSKEIRN